MLRIFLRAQPGSASQGGIAVWADLAHVLFNVKEFIFLKLITTESACTVIALSSRP